VKASHGQKGKGKGGKTGGFRGFAKEKEDNIDKKCGCECDCCQKRNSQYWINRAGALTAAK